MADTDSDLGTRVHSQNDGTNGHVRIKFVGDPSGVGTTATNHVAVDNDKNAHVEGHGNNPTGGDQTMRMSEQGSVSVDGAYDAVNNTDPSQAGLVGMVRNAAPADSQQTLRITGKANAAGDVRVLDVGIRDENGEPFSNLNPFPVSINETEGGNEIHAQNTALALAAAATSNHDYSVAPATTFILHQVIADAAGDARYDIQIGDGAAVEVFTRKAVHYSSNSKSGDMTFAKGLVITAVATARTVRVIRKNMDNKVQDVHTTIVGNTA